LKRNARNQKQVVAPKGFHIQPKNQKQETLLKSIRLHPLVCAIGPAGTGKTYCSAMQAANLFLQGGYRKIVLTRANVPTGRSLGFFPGTVEEKLAPWLAPIVNVLKKAFGESHYQNLVAMGRIELQPLETIRGMSYEDAIIMVDEAQNLNMEEIKAITTRLGEGSKLVLMGDQSQSDVENGKSLIRFVELCKRSDIEVPIIEFGVDDIVRSDIVGQLVRMFLKEKI
jgi:phosphate starvation-inducible PhoH-like protein